MMIRKFTVLQLFLAALVFVSCQPREQARLAVQTGAEQLIASHLADLQGRSVGLVMNPTARIRGTHVLDSLLTLGVSIKALFAPEHGFRGDYGAGERISDGIDEATGLPVYSLYGKTRKPTAEMLEGIDLLIFDIQDVGARFYTYISTMGLVMQAAAEHQIDIWVLDRPNPAGGAYVSGWMLDMEHQSFVGFYPIPVAHGMTVGELALMIRDENWLNLETQPNLTVIRMNHWQRRMLWPDTGLEWIPPSPNLPTFESAWMYLGTCFFEGSTLSEGRGTDQSFLLVGAPGMAFPANVHLQLEETFGVQITDTLFVPVEMPGRALRPKHEGQTCNGLKLNLSAFDADRNDPVAFGHMALKAALTHTPDARTTAGLVRLAGTSSILDYLEEEGLRNPARLWSQEIEAFKQKRKPYLLYD